MNLTEREKQIVAILRRAPMTGSEAIAEQLGTSRASVNVHLSNLGKKGVILGRGYILGEGPSVVVVGGSNIDIKARSAAKATAGTSNPGHGEMASGGVGRNIAENLARLGTRTHLVTAIGRDAMGDELLANTNAAGVLVDHVHRTDTATGTYTAVFDTDGELVIAVADMAATAELGPDQVNAARDIITHAAFLVLDCNLAPETLVHALDLAGAAGIRTILEPVSVPKAAALAPYVEAGRPIHVVTPNRDELAALTDLPVRTDRQLRLAAADLHRRDVEHVWVRLGERGSMLSSHGDITFLDAIPTSVADVTGAGDSSLAAFCHALLEGSDHVDAARFGHAAASLTIASHHTVRPDLTPRLVRGALNDTARSNA